MMNLKDMTSEQLAKEIDLIYEPHLRLLRNQRAKALKRRKT